MPDNILKFIEHFLSGNEIVSLFIKVKPGTNISTIFSLIENICEHFLREIIYCAIILSGVAYVSTNAVVTHFGFSMT